MPTLKFKDEELKILLAVTLTGAMNTFASQSSLSQKHLVKVHNVVDKIRRAVERTKQGRAEKTRLKYSLDNVK